MGVECSKKNMRDPASFKVAAAAAEGAGGSAGSSSSNSSSSRSLSFNGEELTESEGLGRTTKAQRAVQLVTRDSLPSPTTVLTTVSAIK
jgi:hypothetical protein